MNRQLCSKLIAVMLAVMVMISGFIIFKQDQNSISNMKVIISTNDKNKTATEIDVYKKDEKYYAFLPSYANVNEAYLILNGYQIYLNGTKYTEDFALKTDEEYNLTVRNQLGVAAEKTKLTICQSANIPTLFIQINNGSLDDIHSDINVEKTGSVYSVDANGTTIFSGNFKSIKGRGNSSWQKVKKPYNLGFDTNVDLLHMGSAKEYALLACVADDSRIRNKIVFDVAAEFGLKYSPDSDFADLYIDGEYRGLYLLTEKFEINENAINLNPLQLQTSEINQFALNTYNQFSDNENGLLTTGYNIKNNPSDITGGYIVELDPRYTSSDNTFSTPEQNYFSVYYPRYCSQKQMNYISNLFAKIENGFEEEKHLQYIDTESWAKYYIIQEFFANVDFASFFFYKDSDRIDPKVYAGPVWDFDLSMGLGGYQQGVNGATNPYRFYVNNWGWFEQLFKSRTFIEEVQKIYTTEFRAIAEKLLSTGLDSYKELISQASIMNKCRWEDEQFCDWFDFEETLDGNIDYISNFLNKRLLCFDSVFIQKISPVKITLISEGPVVEESFFYIAKDTPIDSMKELHADGYLLVSWTDEDEQGLDTSTAISEDTIFTAVWKKGNTDETTNTSNSNTEPTSLTVYMHYIGYAGFGVIVCLVAGFVLKDVGSKVFERRKGKNHD